MAKQNQGVRTTIVGIVEDEKMLGRSLDDNSTMQRQRHKLEWWRHQRHR